MKILLSIVLIVMILGCKNNSLKVIADKKKVPKSDLILKKEKENNNIKVQTFPVDFRRIEPDSVKKDFRTDSLEVNEAVWINNTQLITGTIDGNNNGIHLIVKNKNNELIYMSKGQYDSWRYDLNLFKTENSNKIILINEIGAEESWGVEVHEYSNGIYKEIGVMDIVAMNEYEESLSVVPFVKIKELENQILEFSFNKDVKIYDNQKEKSISGEKVKYRFENEKLDRVE
ncbi:hypothetical protein [Aquimarina sediminis]|uniref:hypothetical protein n=1 Tax=Aquimarina sediminis TaxID=2070536 RepID=UPI000FFEF7DB|nr:hypothetical protein [Aquimarina sediminis]